MIISEIVDLFSDLMPVVIHQALAAYDVRKTELMNVEVNKLRDSTQLLNRLVCSRSDQPFFDSRASPHSRSVDRCIYILSQGYTIVQSFESVSSL